MADLTISLKKKSPC